MKKLFAALLSLCLMLTAFTAVAEEEPSVINWSDYEEQAANVEGHFAEISDIGLKMFIPAQFMDTELSEEALADGTFMVLKTEDESAVVRAQAMAYDSDQFMAMLTASGITGWDTIVNGIHFLQFNVTGDDVNAACFAVSSTANKTLVFSFAPADQEAYADLFRLMAASMQPAD